MTLTEKEFGRIYELMKWGVEKQNLQDPHFLSAFKKIESIHEIKGDKYIICSKNDAPKAYSSLSNDAKEFINKRIEEGYKNTYHSIMAILGDRWIRNNNSVDKEEFRKEYIEKNNILADDLDAFNEVFDAAFSSFLKKHKH